MASVAAKVILFTPFLGRGPGWTGVTVVSAEEVPSKMQGVHRYIALPLGMIRIVLLESDPFTVSTSLC